MPRARRHAPLNVFLNSRFVGQLNRQASGAIDFKYDENWLSWEHALPVSLSLPLREDSYIGAPVIAVFDNLLPDSDHIRRRVAERVGAEGIDAYSLLTAIGRDCVGALAFLPEGIDPGPAGHVDGRPVSDDEIAHLLGNLAAAPLGLGEDQDFRISVAGAQEKTSLLYWNGGWHKPAGTTAATHIFKPSIGRLPNGIDLTHSVENEFFCLKLIAAAGVPAAEAQMKTFGDVRTLIVERFDRRWTRDNRLLRLPQEDMCQALSYPPSRKYEADGGPGIREILDVLQGSDEAVNDRLLFLKANVMFWLLGATDGHAKNFSVALSPGGRFRLTPLYDVLSAQPSVDEGHIRRNRMKLAMAVGANRHYGVDRIVPRYFVETAAAAAIAADEVEQIFTEFKERVPHAIQNVLQGLPADFPEAVSQSISNGVAARLRLLNPV
jgi:serine/threonine-protein kinase HipA